MVLGHFGRWSKFKYVNLLVLRSKVTVDTIFSVFSILQQYWYNAKAVSLAIVDSLIIVAYSELYS